MSEWRQVKIGDFLSARKGKYKPDDKVVAGLQRVDKIDFSGKIHLSEKGSKTDLIMVFPGDLLISGINVAKGAVAVYHGEKPVVATIHYSTYTFDESLVSIDYFRRFVRSSIFEETLKEQVRGGIKTEIKPKDFLPLQINLPGVETQNEIVKKFIKIENELSELSGGIDSQATLIKQLRQAVLQEAVEGKLTTEWRSQHPVVKGDPQYDAAALLAQIKAEKEWLVKEGKIRKEKPFLPTTDTDKPFNLPDGWVWCRLGDVADGFQYGSSAKSIKDGKFPVLRMGNIQGGQIDWTDLVYTNDKDEAKKYSLTEGDLLFNRTNSRELVGKTALFDGRREALFAGYLVRVSMLGKISPTYSNFVLNSKHHREWCDENKTDALGQSNINATKLRDFLFPLPSLAEQQAIVGRVGSLIAVINKLEKQVAERKEQAQELMKTVLREAFAG